MKNKTRAERRQLLAPRFQEMKRLFIKTSLVLQDPLQFKSQLTQFYRCGQKPTVKAYFKPAQILSI